MTPTPLSSKANRWVLPAAAMAVAVMAVLAWTTISQERQETERLAAHNRALTASLEKVQLQVDLMSRRLSTLSETIQARQQTAQPAPEPALSHVPAPSVSAQTTSKLRRISPATRPASPPADPRVDQLQTRLSGQEKELASTRDQLEQTREALESRLGTTKDELSGSIARTHDELQELKRRGERNYYEFDLYKNKEFSRVGPLGLSLRKADTKRRSYQVKFRLDDQELEKKNVNLFEPILISAPDSPQPLQLVVNEISKDRIRGYVSEPMVKQAAVARSNPRPAALQTRQ